MSLPAGAISPVNSHGSTYNYMAFIPTDYVSNSTKYFPLVICMPGLGQNGNGSTDGTLTPSSTNQLAYVLQLGPLGLINNGSTYFNNTANSAIIVQPQTSSDWSVSAVKSLVNSISGSYRVDSGRIHIMGLSEGGGGAWLYAQTHGSDCCSVIAMAGAAEPVTSANYNNFENIIAWGIQDSDDTTVRPPWTVGCLTGVAPTNFAGWLGFIADAYDQSPTYRPLDTNPDSVSVTLGGTGGTEPVGLSGVNATRSCYYSPTSGWGWTDSQTFIAGCYLQGTVFLGGGHNGWDQTMGSGTSANTTFWNWLLAQRKGQLPSASSPYILVTPFTNTVANGSTQQLTATAYDTGGNSLSPQPTITWSLPYGTGTGSINGSGLFTSSGNTGIFTATATATISGSSYSGSTQIKLTSAAPSVFTSVALSPLSGTVANGQTEQLTAIAYDQYSNPLSSQPTFTWSAANSPAGGSAFGSINSSGLFTAASNSGTMSISGSATVSAITKVGTASITMSAAAIVPSVSNYPNAAASGSNKIAASLAFSGSQYVTLGTPSALTTVLQPNHEFTVLVRTARTTTTSTGVIIGQGDESNTTFEIQSLGGSSATCVVGGNSISTGSGSIKEPTWNCIGLINRNAGGGQFMSRAIIDGSASTAEVSAGPQVCTKDILIGARRNASNTDSKSWYSGNVGCIAIWNYAMTDAQIHYAMGYITPNENIAGLYGNGLVAYYPCNETSGTTLHDCVAGNNGTLSTSGLFTTTAYPKYPVAMVGDSLVTGAGSETNTPPGNQLVTGGSGIRNMRSVYTYGFGGQNTAYILSQVQLPAFSPFLNWTQVYAVGAQDWSTLSSAVSGVGTMVSMLPHNRFILIGQRPYGVGASGSGNPNDVGGHDYGTTGRSQVDAMNYTFRAIYGSRWFDAQANAIAQASLPLDTNDVFQRRTPVPICYDNVHMLDEGYIPQSQAIETLLNSFGW